MSNMKCPFCNKKLEPIGTSGQFQCGTWGCDASFNFIATRDVWEYIDRTRKALEVAVDALKEQQRWFGVIRVSLISHLNNQYGTLFKSYDADPTVVNVKRANDILNTALNKITALEQKDVK